MIGGAQDPAEKEADETADRVMRVPAAPAVVQRECECGEQKDDHARRQAEPPEEAETEEMQRSAAPAPLAPGTAPTPASAKTAMAISNLGPTEPLSRSERAFFEPRFGADLSDVRIHDSEQADRAARSIDARAFTLGSNVVFARHQRDKGNPHGNRVLAHELAHVTRESSRTQGVRRATLGTADLDASFKKVPRRHHKRVNAALKLIEKQTNAKKCAAYFKDKCSGGAVDEIKKAFKDSTVYYMKEKGGQFGSSDARTAVGDPRSIAYNKTAYKIGHWELASTLLHEMFHTCIIGNIADEEKVAETGVETCEFYTPWTLRVSKKSAGVGEEVEMSGFQYGPQHDANHKLTLAGLDITPETWAFTSVAGKSNVKILFKVPAGAKSGDLVVTNHGVKSNPKELKVLP